MGMGYKFQFIILAGFHALNLAMFELARAYPLPLASACVCVAARHEIRPFYVRMQS
jgi:isocitrate lyase